MPAEQGVVSRTKGRPRCRDRIPLLHNARLGASYVVTDNFIGGIIMSLNIWTRSLAELRRLRVVVLCGIMGALSIALEFVGSISFGPFVKIGIVELPNLVIDFLFGPAVGGIFAGVMDILKYLANPAGPFFPGFTISAVAGGVFFGFFLYGRKLSIKRLVVAEILVKIFVNIGLNTLWLNILYHKAILAILPARIVSNILQLPVDILVIYMVLQSIDKTMKPAFENQSSIKFGK